MKRKVSKYLNPSATLIIMFMLIALLGQSQNLKVNELISKFEFMDKNLPYNKLFLATDKHFYFSSDTIFFQAYLTDLKTNTLTKNNVIGHVALLNKKNKALDQIIIKIKDGLGTGYFAPQQSIDTDEYFIVAYTGAMKNYASDFYFNKKILIYNGCLEDDKSSTKPITMNFYSEGGNFVEGISNRISFEIPLANKNFKPDYVVIKNDVDTDSILTTIDKNGIGTFDLKHKKGRNYFAQIYYQDTVSQALLPKFKNANLTIKANVDAQLVNVELQPSESLATEKSNLILFFYQGTKLLFLEQIKIVGNNKVVYKLPTQTMTTGLSHLVILNEDMKIVVERLLFIDKSSKNTSVTLIAKDSVAIKSKQQVKIKTYTSTGTSYAANYSVNSIDHGLLEFYPDWEPNIISYQYLTSELNDRVFNANYYFTLEGKTHINNMLIAKKSTRINWSELASTDITQKVININRSSLSFQGRAEYLNSKVPVSDSILLSFYMPKTDIPFETYTDDGGNIDVNLLFEFERDGTAIYHAVSKNSQSDEQIVLNLEQSKPTFSFNRLNGATPDYAARVELRADVIKNKQRLFECNDFIQEFHRRNVLSKNINNSYHYYLERNNKVEIQEKIKGDIFSNAEYHSDFSRNLDEYVPFESMIRVVKEILPTVFIRKRKGLYTLRVYNQEIRHTMSNDPLIIIDGSPTYDLNKFLDFNPANIQTVDVISSYQNLNKFGNLGKHGVIVIKSKADKIAEHENKNIIKIKGLQRKTSKTFPVYDNNNPNEIPDFRSTIFWSPSNLIDINGIGQLEYYHSDDVSDFVINIQGIITETGEPFQKQVTYKATF